MPVPDASFLGAYAKAGAYTDCYRVSALGNIGLAQLIEAFYTTPLFKLERWVLATFFKLPSTDQQARQVAQGHADRFAAWKVERRAESEILLDAGQTRLWLSVVDESGLQPGTTLMFGSAVVPTRPNGKFGLVFHALLRFHQLYSKLLLAAAARSLASTSRPNSAA